MQATRKALCFGWQLDRVGRVEDLSWVLRCSSHDEALDISVIIEVVKKSIEI